VVPTSDNAGQPATPSPGKASGGAGIPSPDSALAASVLARDRKAAAEFVSRHADRIYAYVYSRLAPRVDLVEDVMQEVFLAAWESLASFRGQSSLEAWLVGIARHKVEDYYRSRLREPLAFEEAAEDLSSEGIVLPEFEQQLDDGRTRERALQVLAGLPEHYRLVLFWRYWEKRPAREIAARTGRTEKAVERLLARARGQFKKRWQGV
jgi:RNA polymerase sigma-70 factor, ECF subfamily